MHIAKFAMNILINLWDKCWACCACRRKTNAKSQEGYAAANKNWQRWSLPLYINSVGEMPLQLCVQLLSAYHKAVQVLQTLQTASSARSHTNPDLSSLTVTCSLAGSSVTPLKPSEEVIVYEICNAIGVKSVLGGKAQLSHKNGTRGGNRRYYWYVWCAWPKRWPRWFHFRCFKPRQLAEVPSRRVQLGFRRW